MTDPQGYSTLATLVEAQIFNSSEPLTQAGVRDKISSARSLLNLEIDDADAERLARELEARHGVTMTIGSVLKDEEFVPWLDQAKTRINSFYWPRYVKLLQHQKFPRHVIASLDKVTDRTLGLLEDPSRDGVWDRRGMVVGHVQSGKTANYTGLICKAADAGYRVIIVIAGIHNNLRNQTQIRLDEGFVGRESAQLGVGRAVGVGRLSPQRTPTTFTTSVRDFNQATAESVGVPLQNLNEPALFVIKKNASTLRNLLEWLTSHSAHIGDRRIGEPVLIIDDEADNASINIAHGAGTVSRINSQIRKLLQLFKRSSYVGYTATPFANIFIDPDSDNEMLGDDLFPRSFIVSLDPPSNYFGPRKVFLEPGEPSPVECLEDYDDLLPIRHKRDWQVRELPESMLAAIRAFVVAKAVRILRGQGDKHHSMLVNASRFTDVQKQLGNEIQAVLRELSDAVEVQSSLPPEQACRDPHMGKLMATFEEHYVGCGSTWSEVQSVLRQAVLPVRVAVINSKSSDTLPYRDHPNGLNVIAVGGFSLSRGLTLEGLVTSYFLRNSMMYDTLMQMGRWFGYRDGYEDLCRIWMPEDAEGWYSHIAETIEDLREDLRYMEVSGATPAEFGLRVRSHPETLLVTARNKMGSGERVAVSVGLATTFVETSVLEREPATLEANRRAAARFAEELVELGHPLSAGGTTDSGFLLHAVPVAPVLRFLSAFVNHEASLLTATGPVRRYIEDRCSDELADWDIWIPSLERVDVSTWYNDSILGVKVRCQQRTAGTRSNATTLRIGNKQRVSSRGVERKGLDPDLIERAEAEYLGDEHEGDERSSVNFPDRIYRRHRVRPLLILHLLKINEMSAPGDGEPVVAWSISFPATNVPEKRVEYVVNTVWLREQYRDDAEDDELGGDDE